MAKMSGGEALAKALVSEGVEVVFGIPGIPMYGIIAAMRDEPNIRMISTRHEQATTYMADGYSRVSGKPGVALVVPGVGMYNAAAGLATAYARSSPVLMIAGQIPRGQIGKNVGAVHEVLDQADIVRPVTKWRRQVMRPREIPDAVRAAFRQMRTGRPRPVLIEVPPEAGVEQEEVELRSPAPVSRIVPSPEQLREAARIIVQSRLPLIYAGGGVAQSDAEAALVKLAEATNIPVVTSTGGKGTIPDSHPLSYGSCFNPGGEKQEMNQLFEVMQSADVVIGIGARFSLGNPAGESSLLLNINVDDSELTRIQSNCLPLHGDARATIEALLPLLIEAGAGDRPSPAEAVTSASLSGPARALSTTSFSTVSRSRLALMRRLAALNAEMRARRRVLSRRWLAVGHPFLPPAPSRGPRCRPGRGLIRWPTAARPLRLFRSPETVKNSH